MKKRLFAEAPSRGGICRLSYDFGGGSSCNKCWNTPAIIKLDATRTQDFVTISILSGNKQYPARFQFLEQKCYLREELV